MVHPEPAGAFSLWQLSTLPNPYRWRHIPARRRQARDGFQDVPRGLPEQGKIGRARVKSRDDGW